MHTKGEVVWRDINIDRKVKQGSSPTGQSYGDTVDYKAVMM